MDDEPVKFTRNKRLKEKGDGSHIAGSTRDIKKFTRHEYEHQQDIDEAFRNY